MDIAWVRAQFPDLSNLVQLTPSGQKEVFSAIHTTEGPVMLKIFHPGASARRIEREVQAPLKVKSSKVPKVAEVGRRPSPTGEIVWLRERKIEGRSLRQVLSTGGPMAFVAAIKIGLHVVEVLAAAEQATIVHRDIKPENIIVDPCGNGWVIDFGVARHLDMESLTDTANPYGPCTPGYSPVEQFKNQKRDIDARADLFATGVTFYEMVHGENPFTKDTKSTSERLARVTSMKLPRICVSGVPTQFIDLVEAMTRTKAAHRLPTAGEALDWIQEIAADCHVV